jgi:hypothetical protein
MASALVLCAGDGASALADSSPIISPAGAATNSPTVTTSATASATPYPQSTISIRFVGDLAGTDPVSLNLDGPISKLLADGVDCTPPHSNEQITVTGYTIQWPRSGPDLPLECTKGPPTDLHFEFTQIYFSPPPVTVHGTWQGSNLEILDFLPLLPQPSSPTPTPTPAMSSATTTAASLPRGGGAPVTAADSNPFILMLFGALLTVMGATAVVAFASGVAKRRR